MDQNSLNRTMSIGDAYTNKMCKGYICNTVRISAHGVYNLTDNLQGNLLDNLPPLEFNKQRFYFYFRANVGECVMPRTSTIAVTNMGIPVSQSNRDFGISDFKPRPLIIVDITRDNYNIDIYTEFRNTPNISLGFNTDKDKERMYLGYSLYYIEGQNGRYGEYPEFDTGFQQFDTTRQQYTMKLLDREYGYNVMSKIWDIFKSSQANNIHIYVSSCLYVNPNELQYNTMYPEWFSKYNQSIKTEYVDELNRSDETHRQLETRLQGENTRLEDIKRKYRNIPIFISILNGEHPNFDDYIQNYFGENIDECPINEINEELDKYDSFSFLETDYEKVKNSIIDEFKKELENIENEQIFGVEIEIDDLSDKLSEALDKSKNFKDAIEICNQYNRNDIRQVDKQLQNINNDERIRDGGRMKTKKKKYKKKYNS